MFVCQFSFGPWVSNVFKLWSNLGPRNFLSCPQKLHVFILRHWWLTYTQRLLLLSLGLFYYTRLLQPGLHSLYTRFHNCEPFNPADYLHSKTMFLILFFFLGGRKIWIYIKKRAKFRYITYVLFLKFLF